MTERLMTNLGQIVRPKGDERNFISATFHMLTITLISMSLVNLTWFNISGDVCVPYITLWQFFWLEFSKKYTYYAEYDCINAKIINMLRIIVLLCFMAIIFALLGFFLDIIGPRAFMYRLLRKYAVLGTCTVLWTMTIISISYYIVTMLENAIRVNFHKGSASVTYGLGFYLIVAAGGVGCLGIMYTFTLPFHTSLYVRDDDRCLIESFDDNMETFNSPTPPPPYNGAPPPYSP